MRPISSPSATRPALQVVGGLMAGLRPILGLLVSGLFLWLAFRRVQVDTLLSLAYAWPVIPIVLSLLLQAAAFVLRLVRWGLVNRQMGEIAWGRILAIGSVGLGAVFLLPVRLGEVVRPALISSESDIDFGRGSAAVVLERVVDGWIMSMTLLVTLIALGGRAGAATLQAGASIFAGGFVIAGAIFLVATGRREQAAALLGRLIRRFSRPLSVWLSGLVRRFLGALGQLISSAILPRFVLLSLAMWLVEAASIYVLFGILEGSQPWLAAMTVLSALVLGTTLPSGPAHLGVFEYAVLLGLGFFAIESSAATAFGVLLHTLETLTVLAFGLAGVWAGGLRSSHVLKLASAAAQATHIQRMNNADR